MIHRRANGKRETPPTPILHRKLNTLFNLPFQYNVSINFFSKYRLTIELKAPTSPATLLKEDSLTYLNQDQPYSIQLFDSFGEEHILIKVGFDLQVVDCPLHWL